VLEPDFTPDAIDGLSLNRLSAMSLRGRIGSGLFRDLRGFPEKLHSVGQCIDKSTTDPQVVVALPYRQSVGKYLLSRVQQLTNKIFTVPFALPDNDGRHFAPTLHCPFVAIKQPLLCPASPAQRSGHSVAPLDFHSVAAAMLRHLSST